MKKNFIALYMLVLFCSASTETPVEIFDLAFTCPAEWYISEQDENEDDTYISIEKKGFSESGLVMITYTDEEISLLEYLEIFRESFKEDDTFSEIVFTEVIDSTYGRYPGIYCDYTFSIMSLPHEGRFYIFHTAGKTVCITEQEATEDKDKNKPGFELIRESLIIK